MAAQRLKDRVNEQVLHADVGQVASNELLVVLPEPVGNLADCAFGDKQLTSGIAKGVLHILGGQFPRIHLAHQPLKDLGVAVQKAHQARPKRLPSAADLRHRHLDRALRGAHPARLVPLREPTCPSAQPS